MISFLTHRLFRVYHLIFSYLEIFKTSVINFQFNSIVAREYTCFDFTFSKCTDACFMPDIQAAVVNAMCKTELMCILQFWKKCSSNIY